jgi:uncharacterized membrane protein
MDEGVHFPSYISVDDQRKRIQKRKWISVDEAIYVLLVESACTIRGTYKYLYGNPENPIHFHAHNARSWYFIMNIQLVD